MNMMNLRKLLLKSRGTRLLLAAVFCALFLNGVEYIVHNHAAEQQGKTSAPHAELCGYCAAFNGLSAASDEPVAPRLALSVTLFVLIGAVAAPARRRPFTVAQPRGPPRS
jgi:Protein of unknown function (DUF2946)